MKQRTILIMLSILMSLGISYYFSTLQKETEPAPKTVPYIWDVEIKELHHVTISLPERGLSYAWVIHEDGYWYFDEPEGPKVDMIRWGGGIPLLLTGPCADRIISIQSTDAQIESYGLNSPRMEIKLLITDGSEIAIKVGDPTPTGEFYYISPIASRKVYTVDHTWYEVMEYLVVEPPYPPDAG